MRTDDGTVLRDGENELNGLAEDPGGSTVPEEDVPEEETNPDGTDDTDGGGI